MRYELRLVAELCRAGLLVGQSQAPALPRKRWFFALSADLLRIRESAGR